jgi:hypothetical protein
VFYLDLGNGKGKRLEGGHGRDMKMFYILPYSRSSYFRLYFVFFLFLFTPSGSGYQWEVGGHKETRNEGKYGALIYPYMRIEE